MTFEHGNNFGSLFKNDKEGNEKRPDYTGNCTVNGKPMRMSAWIKEGKLKGKFMSIKFDEPRQKQEEPTPVPEPELDDEIPF